jgi:hypothetical protein
VRGLAGLVAQLGVRVGPRNRRRVGRATLGRRPAPRVGECQLRTLAILLVAVAVAVAVEDGQLGAQALQRGVGLDVRGVDDQPAAVKQVRHAALGEHLREQLLKHR